MMQRYGKRHGRNSQGRGKRRKSVFIQTCCLFQLADSDRHGYELLQGLAAYSESASIIDPSILYRMMREMEHSGLVASYDGETSRGPRRRVYRLTTAGRQQLEQWIAELEQTRDEINQLLAAYARSHST